MPWGHDSWLTDRGARENWMRIAGLAALAKRLLRTPATAVECMGCVVDEVVGDLPVADLDGLRSAADADAVSAEQWTRAALAASREASVAFQSVAILIPDGAPYELELVLVDAPVDPDTDWTRQIVWRWPNKLDLRALELLVEAMASREPNVRREGDYILPLSYAAFVMRDVLCALGPHDLRTTTCAIVTYHGGDSLAVPWQR